MPDSSTRPNILWLSLEDTSPRFGCYGDPIAQTPNIDRLAAEGRLYTHCFSTGGVCAPSRSSIITGLYPISSGSHHMRTTHVNAHAPELPTGYGACLPHYVRAFPEYLRAAGYYCTNNQKTDYQFTPPLSTWNECNDQAHWRNRPESEQPFFAVFNYGETHESGQWEEKGGEPLTDPATVTMPPYCPDTLKARKALARQYDHIHNGDAWIGQKLKELEEDGLAENTVVFIWSDHGEGLPRRKRWPYDGGIHVPLIVRWPGQVPEGEVTDQLISGIDFGATVMSLVGLPVPLFMQGQAFLGDQTAPEPREYIYASRDRYDESYDMIRAVRDGRFKYLRNFRPDQPYLLWVPFRNRHPVMEELIRLYAEDQLTEPQKALFHTSRPEEELYDITSDPDELHNLATDPAHREDLLRLRAECERWRKDVGDYGEIPEDQMRRTWYGEAGKGPQTAVPLIIPLGTHHAGRSPLTGDTEEVQAPLLLQLYCSTQGASMVYTFEEAEEPRWQLYTGPIRLQAGQDVTLRTRACRYGFTDSDERRVQLTVK